MESSWLMKDQILHPDSAVTAKNIVNWLAAFLGLGTFLGVVNLAVGVLSAAGTTPHPAGSLSAAAVGADSLDTSGAALVSALLAAIAAGEDIAEIVGEIASGGVLAVMEDAHDVFAAIESAPALDLSRTLTVGVELRSLRVLPENWVLIVPAEVRVLQVADEGRTITA